MHCLRDIKNNTLFSNFGTIFNSERPDFCASTNDFTFLRVCVCTDIFISFLLIIAPKVIFISDQCWSSCIDYDISIVWAQPFFSFDTSFLYYMNSCLIPFFLCMHKHSYGYSEDRACTKIRCSVVQNNSKVKSVEPLSKHNGKSHNT